MSKHTRGPWQAEWVVRSRPGQEKQWIVFGSDVNTNGLVCDLTCSDTLRDPAEIAANAHLIAAAPELLAALRAIVFQACQGKVLERDACIGQARSAIAKAEVL
jgi:hypothetical protein